MKYHMNEERLALYLRGDLSGADYRAVAQHVEACVECHSTLEDFSRSPELLVGSFEEPTPAELCSTERGGDADTIRSRGPSWPVWTLAASAVAVVLILFADLGPRTQIPQRRAALVRSEHCHFLATCGNDHQSRASSQYGGADDPLKAIVLRGKPADVSALENTIRELDSNSSDRGSKNVELTVVFAERF